MQTTPQAHVNCNEEAGVGAAATTIQNANFSTPDIDPSSMQQAINTEVLAIQKPHNQSSPNPIPKANAPLKISSNFDKPTNTKKPKNLL